MFVFAWVAALKLGLILKGVTLPQIEKLAPKFGTGPVEPAIQPGVKVILSTPKSTPFWQLVVVIF